MTASQHTLQCRAPGGLVRALARAAAAENRTRSSIIQEAVQEWLQRRELRVLSAQSYGADEFPLPGYADLADLDDTDWAALYPDPDGQNPGPEPKAAQNGRQGRG